jgi:lipopolysaccharide/colanic/teichoic acid biosynthesis glycosyltransferase
MADMSVIDGAGMAPGRLLADLSWADVLADEREADRVSVALAAAGYRVLAVLLLLLALPVFMVVACAISVSSPGPVLFRQRRVGRDGTTFVLLKFRTMHQAAEQEVRRLAHLNEQDGPLFKIRHDPRVFKVGRWLRKTSLDELPQLVNVVLGHMSLVGPRPALPAEVETYDPVARRRLAVPPGLTGLWQVSGRSDLDWQESLRLDLMYVERRSLWLDLSILIRTPVAVLTGRGAY